MSAADDVSLSFRGASSRQTFCSHLICPGADCVLRCSSKRPGEFWSPGRGRASARSAAPHLSSSKGLTRREAGAQSHGPAGHPSYLSRRSPGCRRDWAVNTCPSLGRSSGHTDSRSPRCGTRVIPMPPTHTPLFFRPSETPSLPRTSAVRTDTNGIRSRTELEHVIILTHLVSRGNVRYGFRLRLSRRDHS